MNLYNVKNIKDLPQLEQILPGNYLVVENFTGTNKIDFNDFVIGPRNTSFYNFLATDILAISSLTVNNTTALRSASAQLKSEIKTLNDTVTSTVEFFSPTNIYYRSQSTSIGVNQTSATMLFTNVDTVNLTKSKFNLQFDGLIEISTSTFKPNSGFNLKYNWWYEVPEDSTVTLYVTADNSYPAARKLFSATLSYFNLL